MAATVSSIGRAGSIKGARPSRNRCASRPRRERTTASRLSKYRYSHTREIPARSASCDMVVARMPWAEKSS